LLSNGTCIVAVIIDPYCINVQGEVCLACVSGYYLPTAGNCTLANPLCKTLSQSNGQCLTCYDGYNLINGNCILVLAPTIPYCNTQVQNACTNCVEGFYISNGQCLQVTAYCQAYSMQTGVCLSCFQGYVFQNSVCIYPSLGVDPNCGFYTGSYCSTCKSGYVLVNYFCTASDPHCLSYDGSGMNCL
jgi:hypothetical protein